ncbi:MAG: 50S ribosomal protein L24 [Bacteroidetes bacterium]|nr:MAG: 50S ribosomal protein L24 [Bacteroidota bacterium]
MKRLHIRKGDMVYVTTGRDRGAKGKVLAVFPKRDRAIVEGVNMVKKHVKPNAQNTQGGIVEQEAAIHVSNLMLLDPESGEPTRIGRRRNEEGKLVRYSKKSNREIK